MEVDISAAWTSLNRSSYLAKHSPIAAWAVILSSRMVLFYLFTECRTTVIVIARTARLWLGCGQHTWAVDGRNRHHCCRILIVSSPWASRPAPLRCGTPSWYGLGTPRRGTSRDEYRKSVPTSMKCSQWIANNRSEIASWRISSHRAKPSPITMITVSTVFLGIVIRSTNLFHNVECSDSFCVLVFIVLLLAVRL